MQKTWWKSTLRVGLAALCLAALGPAEARADFLDLLVTNLNGGNVTQYDADTGAYKGVFTSTNLTNPRGLVIGPDSNVYVGDIGTLGDIGSADIKKYNGTGTFLGTVASGLTQPHGLAIGPNGNLFEADEFLRPSVVLQFTTATPGTPLGTFASGNNLFNPTGIAFDTANNRLYVASSGSNQILAFNATTGAFINAISGNDLSQPAGLFVAPNGDLFVANPGGSNVLQFNAAGTLLNTIADGAIRTPSSAILDRSGNLLVASFSGNEILRFTPSGGTFTNPTQFARTGLNFPVYLALAPLAIPEPSSLALASLGLAGLLAFGRRRLAEAQTP